MPCHLDATGPQMSTRVELTTEDRGEAPNVGRSAEVSSAMVAAERPGASSDVMALVVSRDNLFAAYHRVKKNKGAPGIDGMTVHELRGWLVTNWQEVREQLLAGTYEPAPVRRVLIPKPGGGERMLGIPTVVDRLIQQALLQVLQPAWDASFSDHSYGFRPGRSAHDALRRAQKYIQGGRRWVVDIDLERFFDEVNHDILMARIAARVSDWRVLRVIRAYLRAGIMSDGVAMERHKGTPQGGPLSPLLANLLLDEVDKTLEASGHAFVRYADDCNVYVRSKRAGERVYARLEGLYARLHLRVNRKKSAVSSVYRRQFLGYAFWASRGGRAKLRIAKKSLKRMKARVRQLTRRNCGLSIGYVVERLSHYLRGWKAYFKLASTPRVLADVDKWIRHRLRAIQLKQWKRPRTIYREILKRGGSKDLAARVAKNARRWWRNSAMALNRVLPNSWLDGLGLYRLAA